MFNKIDKFQDMCELVDNKKSDEQLVGLAYLVFSNTGVFINALKKWNTKIKDYEFSVPSEMFTKLNLPSYCVNPYHSLRGYKRD